MTGNGTQADPYKIYDVNDLQAIENDRSAYYELANDIDASATSGWNGGAGFVPIGTRTPIVPEPDGDVMDAGSWAIYPDDGVFYDKLLTYDTDTTYIQAQSNDCEVVFSFPLAIPSDAVVINVRMGCRAKKMGSGTTAGKPLVRINGINYLSYDWLHVIQSAWGPIYTSASISTNPATGLAWTPDEINGIGANALQGAGVAVLDATPNIRFSHMWIYVYYKAPFTGQLDGKGFKVSDLYINRPSRYVAFIELLGTGGEVKDFGLENVDMTGVRAGSLFNWIEGGSVSRCFTTGSVKSSVYCGGFVNEVYGGTIEDCWTRCSAVGPSGGRGAGFVRYNNSGTIRRCYSAGLVGEGDDEDDGFCGYTNVAITACFWDTETSGQTTSHGGGGVVGKTTAEMKTESTFTDAGWDFDTIWGMRTDRNDGYAYFQWQFPEVIRIKGNPNIDQRMFQHVERMDR